MSTEPDSVSSRLAQVVVKAMADEGGWLPFDRYMELVLYTPGFGYYANSGRKFGAMPSSGSDFVTAPELSPLFGRALAAQVAQGLQACGSATVTEFGAGSGALAEQLLDTLGEQVQCYQVIELSGHLRSRQAERLARHAPRVHWLDRWPERLQGVVLGNEVLDAMPVKLLASADGRQWMERGVAQAPDGGFIWADRATALVPPLSAEAVPGTVTELHQQAPAFIATLAERLERGLALFIDYGFPQAEYYHPQRWRGTLACHRAHRADFSDDAPLRDLGLLDITAHVDFTGIALAGQDAGLDVAGYTSQARFLVNCGLPALLEGASVVEQAAALKLITEHEMGELFKVIAFTRGIDGPLLGFSAGDRSHRL